MNVTLQKQLTNSDKTVETITLQVLLIFFLHPTISFPFPFSSVIKYFNFPRENIACAQGQTREAQTLPTQVSFAVIRNPSEHLTRQRYEPAVLTHSSPDGHEAVPRLHSSTSGRKDIRNFASVGLCMDV